MAEDLDSDSGSVNVEPMLLRFRDLIPRSATAPSGNRDSTDTMVPCKVRTLYIVVCFIKVCLVVSDFKPTGRTFMV